MNRQYPYISLLKTLAMLSVVLLHSAYHFVEYNFYWPLKANHPDMIVDRMVCIMEYMVVPGFFMASGFLLTRSVCLGNKSLSALLKGRCMRLLIPFFATGILYLVPVFTLLDLPAFCRPAGAGWIDGYKAFFQGKFEHHLWFLMALFWSTLIYLFMAPLLRSRKLAWGAVGIAVVLAWVTTQYLSNMIAYNIYQQAQPLLMMALGTLLYHYHGVLERLGKWSLLPGLVILTVGILCVIFRNGSTPEWHCCNLICTLGIAVILYGLTGETPCRLQLTRAGKWMEKNGMLFYLMHAPFPHICFVYIYEKSAWVQSWPGLVFVVVFFPVAVLCTIVMTHITGKVLSKLFPRKPVKAPR